MSLTPEAFALLYSSDLFVSGSGYKEIAGQVNAVLSAVLHNHGTALGPDPRTILCKLQHDLLNIQCVLVQPSHRVPIAGSGELGRVLVKYLYDIPEGSGADTCSSFVRFRKDPAEIPAEV